MEFKNKRILVVCKETYSYPLYYLSKIWMNNNQVAAFFFNPSESQYKKCFLNDTTYYKFKELGIPVFTSNEIAEKFNKNYKKPPLDQALLTDLERKYSHYKNFNEQILSTQFFTRHYHYRNYMVNVSYEQQQYWLQLNYSNVEDILDRFKPDVIIDTDCAELGRTVLAEIAFYRSIPYMTLEFPRYDLFKTISFRLGYGIDDEIIEAYNAYFQLPDEDLQEEIEYVVDFRNKVSIMSKEYVGDITASYQGISTFEVLKKMVGHVCYFYDQDWRCHNYKLKKSNPILYPNSIEYLKFYYKYYTRKNKLMCSNKYFFLPLEGEKYLYMPLHLIPESSTFVKAPFYINELNIIEAVSKALPIGWVLYVKEHQSMIGERDEEFYKRVNRLPNVKMVQINYYKDPKPWIEKAQGVVAITGTTAFEAALMGKRAIVFGDIMFNLIDGIQRVSSFEDLPHEIRMISDNKPLDNIHSCASYIKAIKMVGSPINLKILLNEGLEYLRNNVEPSETYKTQLYNLKLLYEKAYEKYILNLKNN